MLSEQLKQSIAQACVTIVKPDGGRGRGVLVPGNLVLTAAHCVTYTNDFPMALSPHTFVEELETPQGRLKVCPEAVEPRADIAVLGALDDQRFSHEVEAFETWCTQTTPVPLCVEALPVREAFPVYIYTHTATWIEASATIMRDEVASLWLDVPGQVEAGTSGSPIVTVQGEVIGVVSLFGSELDETHCVGPQPRPARALPVWVLEQILAAQVSEEA